MSRPTMLLYGNCLMQSAHAFLQRLPRVTEAYDLHFQLGGSGPQQLPPEDVQHSCEIFVYQKHPSRPLPPFAADLVARCGGIRVPMLGCTVLWPGEVASKFDPRYPDYPNSPYPYGEPLIAELLRESEDNDEVVDRYLGLDFAERFPLGETVAKWRRMLERLESEAAIRISDFIMADWRDRRLFWDFLHPANALVGEVVRRLMLHLGTPLTEVELASISEMEELDFITKPVHPSVVRAFGLTWCSEDDLYRHLGDAPVGRRQWYARYVEYLRGLLAITPEPFTEGIALAGFGAPVLVES